jgi:phospholipase/carboxylesterase
MGAPRKRIREDTSVMLNPDLRASGRARGKAKLGGVLLHGRDRTKKEMTELAADLDLEGVRWLAPAAPAGKWYPNRFFDDRAGNEPDLTAAIEHCDRVMDEATEDGRLKADQIVVAGFSQGACLALEYALRRPGRIGAVLVFTGALIGPPETDWLVLAGTRARDAGSVLKDAPLAGLKVFLTGSDNDEWITERQTRATAHALVDLGAAVRLRIYAGRPHVILPEEIREARAFLTDLRALW